MGDSVEDVDDRRPRTRKPLIAVPGFVLLLCLFLPTLRVCGSPTMPVQFPPVYAAYLGGLAFGILALATAIRTRRVWFTVWFAFLYATVVAWLALATVNISEIVGGAVGVGGAVCLFVILPAFHRQRYGERAFWIGAVVFGVIAAGWNSLLAADHDAMWGAYIALGASIAFVVGALVTLVQHGSEEAARRRMLEPQPLPTARVVER
jgi:hypothetical protein